MKQIALNAGIEGGVVVEKVRNLKGSEGLNAATGEYEDLVKAGVIDAAKVTRSALQNAASIAALFLTTEAVVADKPGASVGGPRHARWRHGRHGRHGLLVAPPDESERAPCGAPSSRPGVSARASLDQVLERLELVLRPDRDEDLPRTDLLIGFGVGHEGSFFLPERQDERAGLVADVGVADGRAGEHRLLRDVQLLETELDVTVVHDHVEELTDVRLQHERGRS